MTNSGSATSASGKRKQAWRPCLPQSVDGGLCDPVGGDPEAFVCNRHSRYRAETGQFPKRIFLLTGYFVRTQSSRFLEEVRPDEDLVPIARGRWSSPRKKRGCLPFE